MIGMIVTGIFGIIWLICWTFGYPLLRVVNNYLFDKTHISDSTWNIVLSFLICAAPFVALAISAIMYYGLK
jgi:hypothetical protein